MKTKAWMLLISLLLIGRSARCADWDDMGVDSSGHLPGCSSISNKCEGEQKTRYGTLQMAFQDPYDFIVTLDGKLVGKFVGEEFTIRNIYSIGANDVLLLTVNSGGTACPYDAYILEITAPSTFKLSEPFGTCSDVYRAHIENSALIIEMPPYFNPEHYKDLSSKDRKEIDSWKESVFTWSNSRLASKYGDFRRHKLPKGGGQG